MTTKDGKTVHPPGTPEWFIPYWEENERQHIALHAEVRKLNTKITNIPKQVIEGLQRAHATGGGNPYSPDSKE